MTSRAVRELLARWAQRFGISGIGVDISGVFLDAARRRAGELGVAARLEFVEADAGNYEAEPASFDVVSRIGASWIGGGLTGTLELMRRPLRAGGLLLVGEPFWHEPPPEEAFVALECGPEDFTSLGGMLDRFDAAGLELIEMVLADGDSWDRYVATQWWTIDQWTSAHRDDPRAHEMHDLLVGWRRSHLEYGRRYLGWGVFVLH